MIFKEAYHKFREIEDNLSLFDKKIDGIPFWDYLRFPLFRKIITLNGIADTAHHRESPKGIFFSKLSSRFHLLKNIVCHNPYVFNGCDYLFLGHGAYRRKLDRDGNYWDIYCDPIIDYLGEDNCILIEPPLVNRGHHSNSRTKKLASATVFDLFSTSKKQEYRNIYSSKKGSFLLGELELKFCEKFQLNEIGIPTIYHKMMFRRQINKRYFQKILDKYNPKAVFLICSYYGKESYIEVCKDNRIPCIELQHGIINEYHLGYSYPRGTIKHAFPDYFFSFGKFWERSVNLPLPLNHLCTIGYPFLEKQISAYATIKKKKNILFISQGPIGKRLSRFALELNTLIPDEWMIVYKLHPGEVADWRNRYKDLAESQMCVIEGDDPSLYELMAEASIQIGLNSTALYEGLAFGCKTYIVDLPGKEYMEAVIESGYARLVKSPKEISLNKGDLFEEYNKDYFFACNWRQNLQKSLDGIESA